jgi:signal transduction histidine kinase
MVRTALIAMTYFLLAVLSQYITNALGKPIIWCPDAVALGLIVRHPERDASPALLACGVAGLLALLLTGEPYDQAVSLAFVHFVCLVMACVALQISFDHHNSDQEERVHIVGAVALLIGSLTVSSALQGVILSSDDRQFWHIFHDWWRAEFMGFALLFFPAFAVARTDFDTLKRSEWAGLMAILIIVSGLPFTLAAAHLVVCVYIFFIFALLTSLWLKPTLFSVVVVAGSSALLFAAVQNGFRPTTHEIVLVQMCTILVIAPLQCVAFAINRQRNAIRTLQLRIISRIGLNNEMQQLLHIISHDLKSPLMTIQGFARITQRYWDAGMHGKATKSMTHVQQGVIVMTDLIDNVLQLSRIGAKKPHFTEVYLSSIVAQVQTIHAEEIAEKSANIALQGEGQMFCADRGKILHAILALTKNALEYGCPRPNMTITIGALHRSKTISLFVRDAGPGVDDDKIPRLFEMFYQGEKGGKRIGAGLAIVKKIAEQHDGRAHIENNADGGATFWISFPANPSCQHKAAQLVKPA